MKVAVIGGGSTYTPELVDGPGRLAGEVSISELMLVDPDAARLSVAGPFCERILRARPPGAGALDLRSGRGPGRRRGGAAAAAGGRAGGPAR